MKLDQKTRPTDFSFSVLSVTVSFFYYFVCNLPFCNLFVYTTLYSMRQLAYSILCPLYCIS